MSLHSIFYDAKRQKNARKAYEKRKFITSFKMHQNQYITENYSFFQNAGECEKEEELRTKKGGRRRRSKVLTREYGGRKESPRNRYRPDL